MHYSRPLGALHGTSLIVFPYVHVSTFHLTWCRSSITNPLAPDLLWPAPSDPAPPRRSSSPAVRLSLCLDAGSSSSSSGHAFRAEPYRPTLKQPAQNAKSIICYAIKIVARDVAKAGVHWARQCRKREFRVVPPACQVKITNPPDDGAMARVLPDSHRAILVLGEGAGPSRMQITHGLSKIIEKRRPCSYPEPATLAGTPCRGNAIKPPNKPETPKDTFGSHG